METDYKTYFCNWRSRKFSPVKMPFLSVVLNEKENLIPSNLPLSTRARKTALYDDDG